MRQLITSVLLLVAILAFIAAEFGFKCPRVTITEKSDGPSMKWMAAKPITAVKV